MRYDCKWNKGLEHIHRIFLPGDHSKNFSIQQLFVQTHFGVANLRILQAQGNQVAIAAYHFEYERGQIKRKREKLDKEASTQGKLAPSVLPNDRTTHLSPS